MKSDLKNLRFGNDTPGGGSSGLPYIKPGLPEDSPAGEYLAGIARTSVDFPIRGGTYSTIASTEDTVRISRFLNDFPKGPIFTSKQIGLQRSNPLTETGKVGSVLNTQTYNTNANLLAQISEQGTGIHINRAGSNTNELEDPQNKYEGVVAQNNADNKNRLLTLLNTKILDNSDINSSTFGISSQPELLFDYVGGPGSVFGNGSTLITRSSTTIPPIIFNNTLSYQQLLVAKDSSSADIIPTTSDFRYENLFGNVASRDYRDLKVNISTRIGIGSPGARTKEDRIHINKVVKGGQDKVNMIPLYTNNQNPFENTKYKNDARDLIKFAIEVIDNNNPQNTTKAHFRAFITNFSDNHSAEWNGQKYMGRGEKFYTYQGFDRQVSFQFKVAAQSKQEMLPLYQKLNYIASSLYPDYSSGGFMRGNIHQLTVGEYFYRTPGIITSMNVVVDDNYPWEIKMTEPETSPGLNQTSNFPNSQFDGSLEFQNSNSDADMMELPQILNVSITFIPILNELPALSRHTQNSVNDKRGILISNDVGVQENFINRIN